MRIGGITKITEAHQKISEDCWRHSTFAEDSHSKIFYDFPKETQTLPKIIEYSEDLE